MTLEPRQETIVFKKAYQYLIDRLYSCCSKTHLALFLNEGTQQIKVACKHCGKDLMRYNQASDKFTPIADIDEPQQVYYQCPKHPYVRVDVAAPCGYYEDKQYRCIFCHLVLVKKVVEVNELP